MKLKSIFILIGAVFLMFDATAQYRRHNRLINTKELLNHERLGLMGNIGLSSYYGDLCDDASCMSLRPNLGVGAMLRTTDNLGIKAELNYFRLYSTDVWERRNLDFRSNNAEFYVAGYYQYFPYEKFAHLRKKVNFYGFLGLGMLYFAPQGSLNGDWYNLRPLETEGVRYSPFTLMIPFGGAITYNVSKHWDVILEVGYRKTFTDRLDDVSSREWRLSNTFTNQTAKDISNKTDLGDDYWLKTGQYRGNPDRKDGYLITQVKFRYTIISRKTHYRLRRAPLRKRF